MFGHHARRHSVWLFPLNSASCNGCDQEIQALHAARYALEEGGIAFAASPRHADILLLTGIMTPRNQHAAWRVLEQLAEPRAVIAVGECPINGSVFRQGVDTTLEAFPIDVELPGCPPSPTLILEAIEAAVNLLDGEGESETAESTEEPEAAEETQEEREEDSDKEEDAGREAAEEEPEEHADRGNRREKP